MNASPRERARAYLATMDASVSGQNGHDAAFRAGCALMNGFGFAVLEAMPLFGEWNKRCEPPWSEEELRHKLTDAAKANQTKPRGYLLANDSGRPFSAPAPTRPPVAPAPAPPRPLPDRSGFGPGTPEQLKTLAAARPYHLEALQWATERGLLVFAHSLWHGFEVYGITDQTGCLLELRRVDGKTFPAVHGSGLRERKSHAVKDSRKAWPVGIMEARDFPAVALIEGGPDFLSAHYLALWEQASHYTKRDTRCAPVAMLSSSPAIDPEALPLFAAKHVRIFPHADKAGLRGAAKWEAQLHEAGAARVDVFDFADYRTSDGSPVNDLWEFVHRLHADHLADPKLWRVMP